MMDSANLLSLSYFAEMSSSEVDIIAGPMRMAAWEEGAAILLQGEQGGGVYFLLEGSVRVEHRLEGGQIIQVSVLHPGAVFGLLGVIEASPRAASCVAAGEVRCAVMERGDFVDLIEGKSTLALRFQLAILRCMARDIRSTNTKLAELVAYPACEVSFSDLVEVFPETEQA
jgi:CRP-like cAMP-binding protein